MGCDICFPQSCAIFCNLIVNLHNFVMPFVISMNLYGLGVHVGWFGSAGWVVFPTGFSQKLVDSIPDMKFRNGLGARVPH